MVTDHYRWEQEEESWPAVDVGNLIVDLDADISNMSGKNLGTIKSSSNSGTGTGMQSGSGVSGSQTTTVTESPKSTSGSNGASTPASSDKSLKMKIKRTKSVAGGRNSTSGSGPDSKHEVVSGEGGSVNGADQPDIPLNATDLVNAVTAAVAAKQGVKSAMISSGGKVKLTSSANSSTGASTSKVSKTNGKANGSAQKSFTPPPVAGNGQEHPAKRQKVSPKCNQILTSLSRGNSLKLFFGKKK